MGFRYFTPCTARCWVPAWLAGGGALSRSVIEK